MGNEIEQVPDDMRGRADKNNAPVSGLREHAQPDSDFARQLYEGAGLGVHPVANLVPGNDETRRRRWLGFAGKYEGAANAGYRGATELEDAEAEGAGAVKRVSDEF